MDIKEIKLSKDEFFVNCDTTSLKLPYKSKNGKYMIDISNMNLISATKIAILCSTYCFLKDFKKKLCYLVKDEETKRAISILCLKNVEEQIIKTDIKKETAFAS